MRKVLIFVCIMLCYVAQADDFKIKGRIIDANTGESVLFASCIDEISGRGTASNNFGYFCIEVGEKARIVVACIGYDKLVTEYCVTRDTTVEIFLKPRVVDINEVVVSATIPEREQVQMGKNTLTPEMIKAIPTFLAEPDLIKSLSYLPGISMGRDGFSSVFVRGGDRGQNLILLDGIKIYNAGHVGGFLSLFNCDVVKSVDVYKGGFPAQYGGRTSSVIDVYTKEGNSRATTGKATLGTLTSGAMIETPIGDNVTCFLAARTMYYKLFIIPKRNAYRNAIKEPIPISNAEYSDISFYDINGKIRWKISPTSSLALTFFFSNDYICNYSQDNYLQNGYALSYVFKNERYYDKYKVKNNGGAITHVKSFGRLFWRNTLSMSEYTTNDERFSELNIGYNDYDKYKAIISTNIKDVTLQSRIEYAAGIHKIKSGVELNHYEFNPGFKTELFYVDSTDYKGAKSGYLASVKAWENSIYFNDEMALTDNLSLEAGARATLYSMSDIEYKRIEPRASLRYLFSNNLSLKLNYTTMSQFNHVMVNTNDGIEEEVWIASTKKIKPQRANQLSAGLFYGNDDYKLNVSLESFYKEMSDLIEYRAPFDGKGALANLEDVVYKNGRGKAYGIETFVSQDYSNFSWSISYTLSRNLRQFDELNSGKWCLFVYDRTHDLNIIAHYRLNKKWTIDGSFIFTTGRPCTLPTGKISSGIVGYEHYVYSELNSCRMPAYHRLDLGVKRYFETQKGIKSQLTLNIYNVYARQNATAVYYRDGKIYQSAMFTIIPSISYTLML